MTNKKSWCRKCSLLQRAFPKLEKHIQQHLVEKVHQDRLPLNYSISILVFLFVCLFVLFIYLFIFFIFLLTYALELAIAKVQRTILRELVVFESVFLHVVAADLFVLFPKAIDLPPSKPLISLVPITCTTYCFQGQGHCYITSPIVFPANHKPCLKQTQDGPPKQ